MNRYQPSNNVSPGRDMPVIRREDGGNADEVVLIPSFTKKTDKPDYYKMFNARSESICEKASFRRLVPNNRCLVTVEGCNSPARSKSRTSAASTKYTAADVRITDQKLRVCEICGAFLSVYDSDRRLADHFGGKLHLGYMLIRDKLAELQV